ncbi:TPA: hypothetical protein U2Q74_002198 [Klebsiella aerogenes]|nr:hypothetical protein [Klebsiella aerogenes]
MFRLLVIMYLVFLGGLGYLLRSETNVPVKPVTQEMGVRYDTTRHVFGAVSSPIPQQNAIRALNIQIADQRGELDAARKSGNLKRLRNAQNKLDTLLARLKTAEGGTAM